MQLDVVRKLKELRRAEVPLAALDAGRRRLTEVMAASPMLPAARLAFWALAWKPAAAALAIAIIFTTGGTVWAAQRALPGDALYSVKMAAEAARGSLAMGADAEFRAEARRAERRLQEADALLRGHPSMNDTERSRRVGLAMARYQQHLSRLSAIAAGYGSEPPAPRAVVAAALSVERMLGRHEALAGLSATAAASVRAAGSANHKLEENLRQPILDALKRESAVPRTDEAEARLRAEAYAERLQDRLEAYQELYGAPSAP